MFIANTIKKKEAKKVVDIYLFRRCRLFECAKFLQNSHCGRDKSTFIEIE